MCCKGTVDGCHWSWWTFKREFFFSLVLAARCGNAEDNGQAFGEACSTNGARLTRKSMNKTFDSNCSQFFELSIWFVVIRIFRSTVWKNCPLTQHFTLSEGLELPLGSRRGRLEVFPPESYWSFSDRKLQGNMPQGKHTDAPLNYGSKIIQGSWRLSIHLFIYSYILLHRYLDCDYSTKRKWKV